MGPNGRLGEINLPVSPGKLWRGNIGKEVLQVLIGVTDYISLGVKIFNIMVHPRSQGLSICMFGIWCLPILLEKLISCNINVKR